MLSYIPGVRRSFAEFNSDTCEPVVPCEFLETWCRSRVAASEVADDDIVAFAREKLGFAVEHWQLDFLTSTARRGIVNCSRQWGKSTLGAIKAIFRAWMRPGCLVLVVSPTLRQSGLFLAKVRGLAAGGRLRLKLRRDSEHQLSLRFPNGRLLLDCRRQRRRIYAGFPRCPMLIIDEAARVPDGIYKALRPMLAVGSGDLWLLSTPMGKRGFFYEEFAHGGQKWAKFEVPATACRERISAEFLEEELADMGPSWVKQEYFCVFLDSESTVFDWQLVEDAVSESVEALVMPA